MICLHYCELKHILKTCLELLGRGLQLLYNFLALRDGVVNHVSP